jgi:hypothetical protein
MSVLEYDPAEELLDEFEDNAEEWDWELEEKVDEGEYVRVELYIDDIEDDDFHSLGADMGVTTGITNKGERYSLSREK